MTAPRERPIIFSAESVRGILAASELARDAREGAAISAPHPSATQAAPRVPANAVDGHTAGCGRP